MDGSPSTAADMLLQRHRSSLQPATTPTTAAAPAAGTALAGGRTSLQKQQRQQQGAEAVSAVAAATVDAASDAELQRMMQAARWGGGGLQQVPPAAAAPGDGGVPRIQQQPLSPVILPAREARQPDIVRHEVRAGECSEWENGVVDNRGAFCAYLSPCVAYPNPSRKVRGALADE